LSAMMSQQLPITGAGAKGRFTFVQSVRRRRNEPMLLIF